MATTYIANRYGKVAVDTWCYHISKFPLSVGKCPFGLYQYRHLTILKNFMGYYLTLYLNVRIITHINNLLVNF